MPCGPGPPLSRLRPPRQTLRWTWAPLPTAPATTDGANDAWKPNRAETARMVWRTSTLRSAAPTGLAGATETSSWPAAYSGWNCSTVTPSRSSAATTSRP